MKKTETKKLVLAKETVHKLDEGLESVQGGNTGTSWCINCYRP